MRINPSCGSSWSSLGVRCTHSIRSVGGWGDNMELAIRQFKFGSKSAGSLRCRALSRQIGVFYLASLFALGCGEPTIPSTNIGTANKVLSSPVPIPSVTQPPIETVARFTEITDASGIQFAFHDGQEAGHFAILESLGGGVALFDYDGDGALDVYLAGGGAYGPNNEIQGLPGALIP